MSEQESNDGRSFNRRNVLKSMTAGIASTSLLASGSVSAATIDNSLTDSEQATAIDAAKQTSEYGSLLGKAGEVYDYTLNKSRTTAVTSTDENGDDFTVVSFFPTPADGSDVINANLAIALQNGEVRSNGLLVVSSVEDSVTDSETKEYTLYQVDDGSVISDSETSDESTATSPQASTASGIPLYITDETCKGCLFMTEEVCEDGCGLGGAAICASIGAGAILSIGCAKAADEFCDRLASPINDTCVEAAYAYCGPYCPDDPESYGIM